MNWATSMVSKLVALSAYFTTIRLWRRLVAHMNLATLPKYAQGTGVPHMLR